jgi:multidrug efflux pump
VLLRKLSGGKQLTDKHGNHPHIHGPDENDGGHSGSGGKGGSAGALAAPAAKAPEPALQD